MPTDTLGHRAGDQLLNIVAERLRASVRESDTIARLSADEFVLILPEGAEDKLSPVVIQRIMAAIAQPIVIEGYEFVMGCCIGVAVSPSDGADSDTLIKHAGIAMYRAKETGRNNFQFYASSMNALDRDELALHYQPQSIDDFGTGYSSLSYLRRFPIDLLKIDQSFVRDLTVDTDDAAIVLSIISLAHSLRLKVIAEGVETEAQLRYLQRHGCDFMQGFFFSRPVPAEECEILLRNRRRLPLPRAARGGAFDEAGGSAGVVAKVGT